MFRLAPDEVMQRADNNKLPISTEAQSICRLATGRSALFHLIHRVPELYASTVLLPTYVAEGVIQPFLAAGVTILFYRLDHDLSPKVEDVEALLERVNGKAIFMLIHYFGFPARSSGLSATLNRYRPVVVEDCAHAMFTTMASGQSLAKDADLALYSLNKFLPLSDGAILLSNRPDINLSINEELLPELPLQALESYQKHLHAGRDLLNSKLPVQAESCLEKLGKYYEEYYAVINSDLSPCRQSACSRYVEEGFSYDSLITKRLRNCRILYKELKANAFSLVHQKLPSGVVPWCVPARVPVKQRAKIIDSLFDEGILLSTLKDKWDFIPADRSGHFEFESAFLDDHVLIPISEFISEDSMRFMVERLNHIKRL